MKRRDPRLWTRGFLAFILAALLLSTRAQGDDKITVVCVGDSITYGEGTGDPIHKGYPAQLQALLGDGYKVINLGRSGATMLAHGDRPYVETYQYTLATKSKAQIVVIMLGTNDSKSQNWAKKSEFAGDTKSLAEHFAGLETKPRVWLCLPPPAFSGAFGISGPVIKDEVLPLVRQVADQGKLGVIDVFGALTEKKALFPDGVHPNEEGAGVIARTVKAAIVRPQ